MAVQAAIGIASPKSRKAVQPQTRLLLNSSLLTAPSHGVNPAVDACLPRHARSVLQGAFAATAVAGGTPA